jgi:hypothetical protein
MFVTSYGLVMVHWCLDAAPAHSPETCAACCWVKAFGVSCVAVATLTSVLLLSLVPRVPRLIFCPVFLGYTSLPRSPPQVREA